MTPSAPVEVEVEGRTLKLTNLDKVLYPATGFTKGQVIDYYRRIAPAMLPHLRDRAITLKRYPNGVEQQHFFEKRCPPHHPDWVPTLEVLASSKGSTVEHCLFNDLPALVWAANLAALELHVPMAKAKAPEKPVAVVFDLDPGPPAGMVQAAEVALRVRDLLGDLGLTCFPKSSGNKGVHLYVPLNTAVTYAETAPFAQAVGEILEKRLAGTVVTNMRKDLRKGKVLVDWSQNSLHKTTICPYSLRATPRPQVTAPVTWEEVEAAADTGDGDLLLFEADEVLERVERHGDLFAPLAKLRQKLPRT